VFALNITVVCFPSVYGLVFIALLTALSSIVD